MSSPHPQPLDDAVSQYFKLKTDHNQRMSDPNRAPKSKPLLNRIIDRHVFRHLQRHDADFAAYFMRYQVLPYDRWSSLSHDQFNYIIRFEHLSDDFAEVLRRIGIEPKRRLPQINTTAARSRDYRDYYPPHTRSRARRVFGPYMERWGYAFPAEWDIAGATWADRAGYFRIHFRRVALLALYSVPRLT